MKPICIYHDNCADGFTAAWVMHKRFGTEVELVPGRYQEPPPAVSGRKIFLTDFSFKRPVVEELTKDNEVVLLDHHDTALNDLAGLPGLDQSHATNDKSGARIAWDFCFPGEEPPALVKYVEDRDLWRFALPDSRAVNAYIFSFPYSLENWDYLALQLRTNFLACVTAGEAIERKHHRDVSELVDLLARPVMAFNDWVHAKDHGLPAQEDGTPHPWVIASLPHTYTSDAGHLMAKSSPLKMALCYWDTPNERIYSLRSLDDGPHVGNIARVFGGGGHAHAAGFKVPRHHVLASV
jgi:hypothetical protein